MLSPEEQCTLDGMAQRLRDEDPHFTRRLDLPAAQRRHRHGSEMLLLVVAGAVALSGGSPRWWSGRPRRHSSSFRAARSWPSRCGRPDAVQSPGRPMARKAPERSPFRPGAAARAAPPPVMIARSSTRPAHPMAGSADGTRHPYVAAATGVGYPARRTSSRMAMRSSSRSANRRRSQPVRSAMRSSR